MERVANLSPSSRKRGRHGISITRRLPKRPHNEDDIDKMIAQWNAIQQLDVLQAKYKHDTFRIGPNSQLKRAVGTRWFNICHHNKTGDCVPCIKEAMIARGEVIVIEEPRMNPTLEDLRQDFPDRKFQIGPKRDVYCRLHVC